MKILVVEIDRQEWLEESKGINWGENPSSIDLVYIFMKKKMPSYTLHTYKRDAHHAPTRTGPCVKKWSFEKESSP